MSQNRIHGFGVSGFRSFAPHVSQRACSFSERLNLFAGRNNAGKSNFLEAIRRFAVKSVGNKQHKSDWNAVDQPTGHAGGEGELRVEYSFPLTSLSEGFALTPHAQPALEALSRSELYDGRDVFVPYLNFNVDELYVQGLTKQLAGGPARRAAWGHLHRAVTRSQAQPETSECISAVLERLARQHLPNRIVLVPALRRANAPSLGVGDHDGAAIVRQLKRLCNPDFDDHFARDRKEKIEGLIASVSGAKTAEVWVADSSNEVILRLDGIALPMDAYGTGIHHALLIATAAYAFDDAVVLLEEPETNLHPAAQRLLVSRLGETSNQYIIATHSPHILDMGGAVVFGVRRTDQGSVVERVGSDSDRSHLALELGIRASDLVQSSAVVWVEGPSDRIYIVDWIQRLCPKLVEGVHYSIVFYGGAMRAHLSATDDSSGDLIALLRVNRNAVFVADSDRSGESDALSSHVVRLVNEVTAAGGIGWVSWGREIENSVAPPILAKALARQPGYVSHRRAGKFGRAWKYTGAKGLKGASKVALARAVVEESPPVPAAPPVVASELQKLTALVEALYRWNGL